MQASLRLAFKLEESDFNLVVEEATLRSSEQEPGESVVLFSGNFNPQLTGEKPERVEQLSQILSRWYEKLEAYRYIINHQFLAGLPETDPIDYSSYERIEIGEAPEAAPVMAISG